MTSDPADLPPAASGPPPWRLGLLLAGGLAVVLVGLFSALTLSRRAASHPPLPVLAQVPDFTLVRHDGRPTARADLAGAPWIADFIFTRCAAICPGMTRRMHRVAGSLPVDTAVRLVSVSVDPEHDTPEVLARYAERHGAGAGWDFLTGDREAIRTLTVEGFLLGLDTTSPATAGGDPVIVHSNRFVLVDAESQIRGYYDAFDDAEIERLLGDVDRLLAKES